MVCRKFEYIEDGVKRWSTILLGGADLVPFRYLLSTVVRSKVICKHRNKMLECREEWEESEGR